MFIKLFGKNKKEIPWEVVESRLVEPINMYDEDEEDFDISHMANEDISRTYWFDITKSRHFRNAIVFARQTMLQDMAKFGYNVLLTEGWQFTLLRRGGDYRAEVRYSGRPAFALDNESKQQTERPPPFMVVLDSCKRVSV